MRGLAARNGGRWGLAALAALLAIGLWLRVDFAWEGRDPVFDAEAYGRIAANLAADRGFTLGEGATQPASNYSPGLPLLVAGVYEARGAEDQRLARLLLAATGSLAILFSYLIGRRLAGPFAGLVGAAAVAVYPALLEYHGMLMGEPPATTLLSGAILAVLWASDPGRATRARRWLVPGLLLGATAMFRPEYLIVGAAMAALVALWIGRQRGWRPGCAAALLMAVGLLLPILPWTVRNAVALDRFVPISTGGGQVLFAGQYLPSGGNPERVGREVLERHPGLARRLPAEPRLEQILAALAEQRHPGLETDRALARMGRERLRREVAERPLEYAGFLAAKLWNLWGHGPRQVMRRPAWELFHWSLLVLAAAGVAAQIRARRRDALPLLVVLLAITALSLVLVASPRRVLVMLPLVAALAGAGAAAARDSLARRWSD